MNVDSVESGHNDWMKEFENQPFEKVTVIGSHHSMAHLKGIEFDKLVEKQFVTEFQK